MAKLAVISDSHGRSLVRLVKEVKARKVNSIIFLGDYYSDGVYIHKATGLPTINILGNNEPQLEGKVEEEVVKTINGYKILACHGHAYNIKISLDRLIYRALELQVDICLFGHTHSYFHEVIEGIHFFNPGSPSLPRGRILENTFAIMDLSEEIKFEKVILPPLA